MCPMNPRLLRPLASGFNPKSISGLALWLDAADGSTLFQNSDGTTPATATSDPVGYWGDKSGHGRHATQATAGSRPRVASALTNGRRVAEWHSSTSKMAIASGFFGSSASVFVVAKRGPANWGGGGGGGFGSILHNGSSSAGVGMQTNGGTIRILGGSNGSSFTPDGILGVTSPAIFSGVVDNLATMLAVNGAVVDADAAAGSQSVNSITAMGSFNASADTGGPLNAELAEIIAYSRAVTTAERRRIERYLAAKWGITLAPQVSNAEAQDWISRVYANGGTVSTSTANAVNTFCAAIDAAGIRDRFARLNLFAGNSLNAALVPLYRSTSFGGSALGNATDTNVGPFVSGDYAETGASGGLKGNGSSKWLATGLAPSTLPSLTDLHLSASGIDMETSGSKVLIGTFAGTTVNGELPGIYDLAASVDYVNNDRTARMSLSAAGSLPRIANAGSSESHIIATRRSATDLAIYRSGTVAATSSTTAAPAANTVGWGVLALATGASAATQFSASRLRMYSMGLGVSDAQAAAFSNAVAAFNTALSRT